MTIVPRVPAGIIHAAGRRTFRGLPPTRVPAKNVVCIIQATEDRRPGTGQGSTVRGGGTRGKRTRRGRKPFGRAERTSKVFFALFIFGCVVFFSLLSRFSLEANRAPAQCAPSRAVSTEWPNIALAGRPVRALARGKSHPLAKSTVTARPSSAYVHVRARVRVSTAYECVRANGVWHADVFGRPATGCFSDPCTVERVYVASQPASLRRMNQLHGTRAVQIRKNRALWTRACPPNLLSISRSAPADRS